MSYFLEPSNDFTIYDSPKAGSDAIRSWIFYAGSGIVHASIDHQYLIGEGDTYQALQDFGYTDSKFVPTKSSTRIAMYRDPVERFISTFYYARVANPMFTNTLDEFVDNFDEIIASCKHKIHTGQNYLEFLFATQTYHLGSDKTFYTSTVPYRKFDNIKRYLEKVWGVGMPTLQLPNTNEPCPFTGHVCEFDLTTRQKTKVNEIYAEDYENGWS